ncbi:alpha/beta fold hydrolase [Marinomonas mediterranea]|uniref:alpha/beta fold hydrolase n=1 Tax=Marinomonas mediterranea TaxID=119864 RepID=UPI00234A9EF1|nr:alpha/beta fold hydrolase [Marinomonas mediterranea]WCN14839.1 alpha/beta fold hydrolase [Marinomonas mediterranea]
MNTLFFSIEGNAKNPAIVLGHPLGMNLKAWDSVMPYLVEQFRVIRWDLPGHGLSPAIEKSVESLQVNDLIDPLLAECDALGIDRFHYVGTSIGGMIGQQLVAHHSERLLSATLTNTGAKIGTSEAWLTRQKTVSETGLPELASTFVARWFSDESVRSNPEIKTHWEGQLSLVDDHSYGLLCAWLGEMDMSSALSSSKQGTPIQLIGGTQDVATTPELMHTLSTLLGVQGVSLLEGIGHVPSVECSKELSADILKFVRQNS